MAIADISQHNLSARVAIGATTVLPCRCAGVSAPSHPYLAVPRYPPTSPASVQILPAEPDQPKDRLGEISLSVLDNPSQQTLKHKQRKAAAAMGANALFITSDKTCLYPVAYYDWWYPPRFHQESSRDILAEAVRLT
jgi:hypothetical protein